MPRPFRLPESDYKAKAGAFDRNFYVVQAVELIAGTINITLLSLNTRDGCKMKGRFRQKPVT
jgi:hypothetical protein